MIFKTSLKYIHSFMKSSIYLYLIKQCCCCQYFHSLGLIFFKWLDREREGEINRYTDRYIHHTGCLKKRNLFDLRYLQDGLFKLIVLLGGYSVLPYKPNFGFLRWLQPELWHLELGPSKSNKLGKNAQSNLYTQLTKIKTSF